MSRITYSFDPDFVGPWVQARSGGTYVPGISTAIGKLVEGELRGGVLYCDFNGANIFMHTAGEGNWVDRKLLWMAFDYPFNQLKVKRVSGVVAASNLQARRFDEHLGFALEATLTDAHPDGDLLLYVMRRDSCRWLQRNKHAL